MKRIGRLEVISFTTGFALLTYELAAARVLAPSIGSSTYVWTSVIGVIIAALAAGFWVGGMVADKRNRASDLALLLCLSSLAATFTLIIYPGLLDTVSRLTVDVRLQAVIAAFSLFAPASFLIGMTSPYIAKLNVRSLTTTGRKIASIDAFNSLGGICGTFLTGFVLFGYVGSRQTFFVVALLLISASWLMVPTYLLRQRIALSVAIMMIGVVALPVRSAAIIIDTPSANYEIRQYSFADGTEINGLSTGPSGIQSGVRLDGSSQPVFWYTKVMAALAIERQPKRILMLGGGAFTLPQFLAERLPNSQIDVVEIDPALEDISVKYFNYKQPKNVRLIFNDARVFVNQTTDKYDLVLVDAYGDSSIPFSLMTREYAQAVSKLTTNNGVLVANIIAGSSGSCRDVLVALHAAYASEFGYAYYASELGGLDIRANYIVMYAHQVEDPVLLQPFRLEKQPAYGDNFMPAERLHYACQQQ